MDAEDRADLHFIPEGLSVEQALQLPSTLETIGCAWDTSAATEELQDLILGHASLAGPQLNELCPCCQRFVRTQDELGDTPLRCGCSFHSWCLKEQLDDQCLAGVLPVCPSCNHLLHRSEVLFIIQEARGWREQLDRGRELILQARERGGEVGGIVVPVPIGRPIARHQVLSDPLANMGRVDILKFSREKATANLRQTDEF